MMKCFDSVIDYKVMIETTLHLLFVNFVSKFNNVTSYMHVYAC